MFQLHNNQALKKNVLRSKRQLYVQETVIILSEEKKVSTASAN